LVAAGAELNKMPTRLRLCLELDRVNPGQYEHAARLLTEIGRLLGGWKKSLSN